MNELKEIFDWWYIIPVILILGVLILAAIFTIKDNK